MLRVAVVQLVLEPPPEPPKPPKPEIKKPEPKAVPTKTTKPVDRVQEARRLSHPRQGGPHRVGDRIGDTGLEGSRNDPLGDRVGHQ